MDPSVFIWVGHNVYLYYKWKYLVWSYYMDHEKNNYSEIIIKSITLIMILLRLSYHFSPKMYDMPDPDLSEYIYSLTSFSQNCRDGICYYSYFIAVNWNTKRLTNWPRVIYLCHLKISQMLSVQILNQWLKKKCKGLLLHDFVFLIKVC